MRDAACAEEALLASKSPVDELVDDDEVARSEVLAQAADRRQGDDVGDAAALQRVDIGAEIDLGWRDLMTAPMARQEHHLRIAEPAETQLVRRLAERRPDMPPFDVGNALDLIKPAAPEDAYHCAVGCHGRQCGRRRQQRQLELLGHQATSAAAQDAAADKA